jgi:hypothetical protein
MERQSNLHGRRLDDELEREVQSITRGAPVEARIEAGRAMEDAGDGEPMPQWLVAETSDAEGGDEFDSGLSRGELIARSDLGIHLRPGIFPARRTEVLECAAEEHASLELLGQLEALPDREYDTVQDVWEALGGKREERDHTVPAFAAAQAAPSQVAPATPVQRFAFRFDPWYRLVALPFAVAPASAHVDVTTADDGQRVLSARFGPWCVTTPVDNVADTNVTGPYSLLKTAGPAHVSIVDFGLTFASNGARGLCIRFKRSVPGVAPTGRLRNPALNVTVDDVDGLARALASA